MSWRKEAGIFISLCVAIVLFGCSPLEDPQSAGQTGPWPPPGDFQRSVEIYKMNTSAQSGWQRGEEIYLYKCWHCHNQYTIAAGTAGTLLKDLYQQASLASGQPVNDETVSEKIRNGGPMMPAFRLTLNDADVADLVSYLREGKCCFEGEEPPRNPRYRGVPASPPQEAGRQSLQGGPKGIVRSVVGDPLEAIMVQLISQKTAIRTTVYSNEQGGYEFPILEQGLYTLRIARPLQFRPYMRISVRIDGATQLENIVLERVAESELLPPTPEIAAQLTDAEWELNIPGTDEEKSEVLGTCRCHSSLALFRNRHDEQSWRLITNRMITGLGSELILRRPPEDPFLRRTSSKVEPIVRYLTKFRGPDSKEMPLDKPVQTLPRPGGPATRIVVTEYELPRRLLNVNDTHGDSDGNIWYTSHRTRYFGKLDPRTGIVKEYRVPSSTPGALPGTHRVEVAQDGTVLISEPWAHNLIKLNPRTDEITQMHVELDTPINAPGLTQFGVAPDGSIWYRPRLQPDEQGRGMVAQMDPQTGEVLRQYRFNKMARSYDHLISKDGNFWAGGEWPGNLIALIDIRTGQLWEIATPTPMSTPSEGEFDTEGNAWFGSNIGLIKLDSKTRQVTEYAPPMGGAVSTPAVDKNGEIWGGNSNQGQIVRFNPRTERWVQYAMPEPFANTTRIWIDNSTDPISVWYADSEDFIVRVQPLE